MPAPVLWVLQLLNLVLALLLLVTIWTFDRRFALLQEAVSNHTQVLDAGTRAIDHLSKGMQQNSEAIRLQQQRIRQMHLP